MRAVRPSLSFLENPPGPAFRLRNVWIRPRSEVAFDPVDWRDALVVVERGTLELETRRGERISFAMGDLLCLSDLALRALRNPGPGPVLLSSVSRTSRGATDETGTLATFYPRVERRPAWS